MIPLNVIHKAVCSFYYLDDKELFIKTRKREIVEPRQIFHYLSRKLNKNLLSTNTIGRYYYKETGVKWDHCSVLHSTNVVSDLIETDRTFKERVKLITNMANELDELHNESFKKAV